MFVRNPKTGDRRNSEYRRRLVGIHPRYIHESRGIYIVQSNRPRVPTGEGLCRYKSRGPTETFPRDVREIVEDFRLNARHRGLRRQSIRSDRYNLNEWFYSLDVPHHWNG